MRTYQKYCLFSVLGVLAASFYPLYMGVTVLADMLRDGTVYVGRYPKYIIPYTPVSLALLLGVLFMPLLFRLLRKYALLDGSVLSVGMFFLSELLLESRVIVTDNFASVPEG